MKTLFMVVLLIGFVSVAVFGISSTHAGMQSHGGCIAAITQGADCPNQSNLREYLAFHLDAFRVFLTVTFGENLLFSILTLILLIVGIGLAFLAGILATPRLGLSRIYNRQRENFNSFSKQHLLRWLALHENSPANL